MNDLPKSLYAIFICAIIAKILEKFIEPSEISQKEMRVVCVEKDVQNIKYS